jgi:hypothetical protein
MHSKIIETPLLFLALLSVGAATSQPASTMPTTMPAGGPSASMVRFLDAIDQQKRSEAVAMWDTSTPSLDLVAGYHVDMLLAVARLKHNVAHRFGEFAPYDLHMGVATSDERGDITDKISGDTATVSVASNDAPEALMRGPDSYQMVRTSRGWLLSAAADIKPGATKEQAEQEKAAAAHLISLIDQVGKDVKDGKCADTDDVLKRISDGMGAP